MSSKKIIAVIGATGGQGGSVVKFLVQDATFTVRAITRNPDSASAKSLSAQGVHVVKADSRDPASLAKAFEGTYGVFGVTNYWEPGVGAEGERAQGKALVDAAKTAGVKHFVWSTLDHTEYKAPYWESKADIDDYLKASGVPRTSLYTSAYFENYLGPFALSKRSEGSFDFPLPLITDAPHAIYSVEETGAWVLASFKHPEQWLGKDMRIASEFLSIRDQAKILTEVIGQTVHVQEISPENFEALKDDPVIHAFHPSLKILFHFNKPPFRDPELSHRLYPKTRTFRAWVEANAGKLTA